MRGVLDNFKDSTIAAKIKYKDLRNSLENISLSDEDAVSWRDIQTMQQSRDVTKGNPDFMDDVIARVKSISVRDNQH